MHEMCLDNDWYWLIVFSHLYEEMPDVGAVLYESLGPEGYSHFSPPADFANLPSTFKEAKCNDNCGYFHELCQTTNYSIIGENKIAIALCTKQLIL